MEERIAEYSGFAGARAGIDFHRGDTGKLLPIEYIERGPIYFGIKVDEKLLPFASEEFGDQRSVYGSETIKIAPSRKLLVSCKERKPGAWPSA